MNFEKKSFNDSIVIELIDILSNLIAEMIQSTKIHVSIYRQFCLGRIIILVLLHFLFNINNVDGQTPVGPYRFKHLTVNDGLAQNQINDIVQDSSEFVWIASKNGLDKFDGINISNYNNVPFDTNSLSDSYVKKLIVDSKGRMWVGTQNGLDLYNAQNDNFKRIEGINTIKDAKPDILDIVEDEVGDIWVSFSSNRLAKITLDGDSLRVDMKPIPKLNDHRILTMFTDKDELFLGTKNSLFVYNRRTKKLTQKRTSEFVTLEGLKTQDLPISAIINAKDDEYLWLGTKKGLIKYNKASKNGHYYFDDLSHLDIQFNWEGKYDDLYLDLEKNIIWLSGGYGFAVFDLTHEAFIHYPFDTKHVTNESSGFINCIQHCKDGSIWFGTNGYGVDVFSKQLNTFNHFNIKHAKSSEYQDFSLRSIFESSDGLIWMSSYALYSYNPKNRHVRSYESMEKDAIDFGSTITLSMNEDDQGNLWMGTWDGLYRYNLDTKKHQRYYAQEGIKGTLPESIVYGTFIDSKQNIWALTNSYLCKLDQQSSKFDCVMLEEESLKNANLYATIIEDTSGYFWINTTHGLLKYHPDLGLKKWFRHNPNHSNSLSNDKIKSIKLDDKNSNTLWLGTAGGGLNKLDIETENFKYYTVNDGLPDNVIYGILQDEDGDIWMSTNKGISTLDIAQNKFTNFTTEHGLQSNEFNSGSYFKSSSVQLYFGGLNGYNYFYPDHIKPKKQALKTIITNFTLLDPKINPDGTSFNEHALKKKDHTLILDHDHNVFQIDFAAMQFGFSPDISYEYKLEGWDHEYIISNQSQAIYSNVPNGNYTFKVRSLISLSENEIHEAVLQICIKPPLWLSIWAKLIYAFLSVSLIYILWSEVNNRRKLRNDLELEYLKSQQLKELDEFKTRFFSNISHELRTPLTLILSPLDDIIKDTEKVENIESLQLVQNNARRLLELVDQLLDLSKIQDDQYKINITEQPLQLFIEKIVNRFRPFSIERGIDLILDIDLGQRMYFIDKDVMNKILSNLISNGIKYSLPKGTVIVKVSCIQKLNHHELMIEVKDDGIGIAKQDIQHLFTRFFRAKDSNNQNILVPGTGLGLALVKELVEKCHGNITVKSQKDQGTIFHVILPLDIETNAKEQTSSTKKVTESGQNNPFHNGDKQINDTNHPLILVIDDNQDILNLIKKTLGSTYQYSTANDGLEGEQKATSIVPDLIISDVMMPFKDGYELCASIKNDIRTSHIPFILLTSKSSQESKIDGLKLGADRYLAKPFNTHELRLHVKNLLVDRQTIQSKFGQQKSWKSIWPDLAPSDRDFVEKMNLYLDQNLSNDKLTLDNIAKEMNLSPRQLRRKLNALTNQSPKQYLRSYRLKFAKSLLKMSHSDIAEVAFKSGFSSPAYFSKCFKDEFGKTPSGYL